MLGAFIAHVGIEPLGVLGPPTPGDSTNPPARPGKGPRTQSRHAFSHAGQNICAVENGTVLLGPPRTQGGSSRQLRVKRTRDPRRSILAWNEPGSVQAARNVPPGQTKGFQPAHKGSSFTSTQFKALNQSGFRAHAHNQVQAASSFLGPGERRLGFGTQLRLCERKPNHW